jgi:hypothetical protein
MRADFLVPIGEDEINDRPACLLLVETRFRVGSDEFVRADDAVVDHIRGYRVLDAGIDEMTGRPFSIRLPVGT